jgi:hypothetical protein
MEPVSSIEKSEKTQDLNINNYKKTTVKLPDGTIKEDISIGSVSNKTTEKTEKVNKQNYLIGYAFGINRDKDQFNTINAAKLYYLPLIRDVYIGAYLSFKDNSPNEAGLTLTKLF